MAGTVSIDAYNERTESLRRITTHHAECHERFKAIESAFLAAASLVSRDTEAGKAWHAEHDRLVAWRASMFDPAYKGDEQQVARYLQRMIGDDAK